jgi:hypothetical protein
MVRTSFSGNWCRAYVAVAHGGLWPFAAPNDVRSHVGNWGLTGLVILIVSFVESDPKAKSTGVARTLAFRVKLTHCAHLEFCRS